MKKALYWISTGLLCALLLMSAGMYLFNTAEITLAYQTLGYPTHLIYPNATLKILAVLALLVRKFPKITQWAYAGLFYLLILSLFAHIMINDGQFWGAAIGLILWLGSYSTQRVRLNVKK